jgi:hypothetical protein
MCDGNFFQSDILCCKESLYLHIIFTCHSVIGLNFCCSWNILMLHKTHSAFESVHRDMLTLSWNICCFHLEIFAAGDTVLSCCLTAVCLFSVYIHHYLIISSVYMSRVRIWSDYVGRYITWLHPHPALKIEASCFLRHYCPPTRLCNVTVHKSTVWTLPTVRIWKLTHVASCKVVSSLIWIPQLLFVHWW